jgi:hypothetical protein
MIVLYPSLLKVSAIVLPIPLDPPVTSAYFISQTE